MRILVVTEHYWPEQFRITDFAEGLRERGHDVTVLTGMPSYPGGRHFDGYGPSGPFHEERAGVQLQRVPIVPRGRGRAWELALNYSSFAVAASLRTVLRRPSRFGAAFVFQPSPVTTAVPALLLRALEGTPVAIWVQDLWPETIAATGMVERPSLLAAFRTLSHGIYRTCDRVLCQSRAFMGRLEEAGVARGRLQYLPNWAEDLYQPTTATIAPTAAWEQGFSVMFAGNLGRVQALDTVLDAAALLAGESDVHWVFAGDGPLKAWMEAEIVRRRLQSHVHLLGRLPVEQMPTLFARASTMLVSLKADETMALTIPSKVQSYLACGRPILASLDGEGGRVVEESGAGWASAAGSATGLAENVRRMKRLSSEERLACGRAGRRYYLGEFDRRICVDRAERVLLEMSGA